jgi:hypothetical protein
VEWVLASSSIGAKEVNAAFTDVGSTAIFRIRTNFGRSGVKALINLSGQLKRVAIIELFGCFDS